jgi:hypothetical protein
VGGGVLQRTYTTSPTLPPSLVTGCDGRTQFADAESEQTEERTGEGGDGGRSSPRPQGNIKRYLSCVREKASEFCSAACLNRRRRVVINSAEAGRANLELARQYGLLQEGATGVTLSDLQALEAKEVKSIPLTYFDLEKTLGMFGNLLQVVLGSDHPLTTNYRAFWDLLTRSM